MNQKAFNALSPVAVLERGYSITLLDNGKALRDPTEAPSGTRLKTLLAAGKSVTSYVGFKSPARKITHSTSTNQQQLDLFS